MSVRPERGNRPSDALPKVSSFSFLLKGFLAEFFLSPRLKCIVMQKVGARGQPQLLFTVILGGCFITCVRY